MRTYTHGVIGYLLYVKRPPAERRLAAVGGILPDVIVGVGFIFHVAEPWTGLAAVAHLHALLHHSSLHTVTVALHSFTIIGPLLALAWLYRHRAVPLLAGMLAHALVDLLTHETWAYNHLYPIPLSPVRRVERTASGLAVRAGGPRGSLTYDSDLRRGGEEGGQGGIEAGARFGLMRCDPRHSFVGWPQGPRRERVP